METKAIVNGILAKHTGKTMEEINEMTSFDNYMNAEDSVKFGICDEVRYLF
jgi:ATP-dependent Clp protease protease subunit